MEYFILVVSAIITAFTNLFFYDIYYGKERKVNNTFLIVLLYTLLYLINDLITIRIDSTPLFVVASIITFFIASFLYESKIMIRLVGAVIFEVIGFCAEAFVAFGTVAIIKVTIEGNAYWVGLFLSKLVIVILVTVTSLFIKKSINSINTTYTIFMLICESISIFALSLFAKLVDKEINIQSWIIIGIVLSIIMLNFCVYYMMDSMSEMSMIQEKHRLMDMELELREQGYMKLSESYIHSRKMIHDFNKYLKLIKAYNLNGEKEKLDEYITCIIDEVNSKYRYITTGNMVIDTFVNDLMNRTESIEVKCNTDIKIDTNYYMIPDKYLTIILGNLCDNAYNAVADDYKREERFISITICNDERSFVIEVKNTYDESNMKKESYGINNIKDAVDSSQGVYESSFDNNIYQTMVAWKTNI